MRREASQTPDVGQLTGSRWPITEQELDEAALWFRDEWLPAIFATFSPGAAGAARPVWETVCQARLDKAIAEFQDLMDTPFGKRGVMLSSNVNTPDVIAEGVKLETELRAVLELSEPYDRFGEWLVSFCPFLAKVRPNLWCALARPAVAAANTSHLERRISFVTLALTPHVVGRIFPETLEGYLLVLGNPTLADRIAQELVDKCKGSRSLDKVATLRARQEGFGPGRDAADRYKTIDDPRDEWHKAEHFVVPQEEVELITELVGWDAPSALSFANLLVNLADGVRDLVLSWPVPFLRRVSEIAGECSVIDDAIGFISLLA
jgi:hypothetical protein